MRGDDEDNIHNNDSNRIIYRYYFVFAPGGVFPVSFQVYTGFLGLRSTLLEICTEGPSLIYNFYS